MTWNLGAGLEGKGVIVTGAAGGIGRPVTQAFSAAGAKIMAVDVDQEAVDEVVGSLEGDGHIGVGTDLTDLDAQRELVKRARSEFGNVYVLAHLAAVLRRRSSISDVTEEDWDLQLNVNLRASFFLARRVSEVMIEARQGGRIILFTSQGWWSGGFGGAIPYCASKGGIVSIARGLARTLGPEQITVNTVSPGQVATSMLLTDYDPALMQKLVEATPLGRIAEPDEMAGTVVFLASLHAGFISGATINVSGGMLMY